MKDRKNEMRGTIIIRILFEYHHMDFGSGVYQESNGDERKLWRVECANELLIERPKAQGYHWQAKSESIYAHRTRTCVRIFLRNLSARATLNPFIGLLNVRNSSSLITCVISFTEIRDIEKSSVSLFFK